MNRSVIGRFLQSSLWPTFLRTDSAATGAACRSAGCMSFLKTFLMTLIGIAAVVTPLGLYEGIVAEPADTSITFRYVKDSSPMGFGTPPRGNNTWSRLCGSFLLKPCPNDYNEADVSENSLSISVNYTRSWYDTRIPPNVVDVFQSGAKELGDSVASSFDIQYRSYIKSVIDDGSQAAGAPTIDNGTARTVGIYQPLSSLVLNDAVMVVEGLIVDMKDGGIGFRNHSAPPLSPYGSTWDEDILFIVPETACVNSNLTLDFEVVRTRSEQTKVSSGIFRPSIVDHGGFVNLNKTYPAWDIIDPQTDPNLEFRAYKGAWLTNVLSMAYMNVTSLNNETLKTKSFAYLNSTMEKSFPLYFEDNRTALTSSSIRANSLYVSRIYGDFLMGSEGLSNVSTIGNENRTYNFTSSLPIYSNPFNIRRNNWTSISMRTST